MIEVVNRYGSFFCGSLLGVFILAIMTRRATGTGAFWGAIAGMAALHWQFVEACVAVVLAGALVGFLRYNFPPASIFLGDAGSMLIGLIIGVLAIRCSLKGPATVALAAPAALLVIPLTWILVFHWNGAHSVVGSEEALRFLLDRVGADRVVLGSDWPFVPWYPSPVEWVQGLKTLSPEEKEQILWRNLEALLKL